MSLAKSEKKKSEKELSSLLHSAKTLIQEITP